MKFFIVLILCFLSEFHGSQGTNPDIDKAFEALKDGNVQSVENLLSSISVDSVDKDDYTLLMRAAQNGDEAMVKMLLEHGADVDKIDWLNEYTALQLANKDRSCIWNCDPRDKVNYDHISELLIKRGADVDLSNGHGRTVLHDVAQYGYDKVAELIFDNGGSKMVNYNETGDTPLCYVAYNGAYNEGHNKIAELLIQNGADVNLPCDGEKTPLHLAAIKNRARIVQLLVENGADVTLKDSDGKTPIDSAKSQNSESYQAVIDYLEKHEQH